MTPYFNPFNVDMNINNTAPVQILVKRAPFHKSTLKSGTKTSVLTNFCNKALYGQATPENKTISTGWNVSELITQFYALKIRYKK